MKRILAITLALALAFASASGQNKTPIGSTHAVDFGIYYGYGSGRLSNHAGGFLDINARHNNLRTRLNFEIEQVAVAFCPSGSVELMYMVPMAPKFFFYPLAGLELEMHDEPGWEKPFDFSPEAGLGFEYQFNANVGIFAQTKYKYGVAGTGSAIMGQAGLVFAFGPGGRVHEMVASGSELAEALKAKDDADDAMRAEAAERRRIEAAQAAAEAKAAAKKAAADEAAAKKAAVQRATEDRLAEERAAAEAKVAQAAKKPVHEDIFFKNASAMLDVNAWQQVDDLVAVLKRDPEAKVTLCGYADKSEGSEANCTAYATRRVENIVNAFKAKGIEESRISTEILGCSIAPYQMPESNRVVIVETYH